MADVVLGIDGGNSKTDVVAASTDGRVLARRRGAGVVSPLADPAAWRERLAALVADTLADAGAGSARCAAYYLANVDFPAEVRVARRELERAGLAAETVVRNDTLAVLRAGATRPWGVAVVSGAGINAVGVHPSGRTAGFLALGDYSGDTGGGISIGVQGLAAAMRARDGRGPATVLTTALPARLGMRRPRDIVMAVHSGALRYEDLHQLAPAVFAAAGSDEVAAGIVAGFADEVAVMATALIRRLHLTRSDVEVILGGGTLQAADRAVVDRIGTGVTAVAPRAQVGVLEVAPVFGALVDAWRRVRAPAAGLRRVREQLLVRS
ncbi:MAG TPA: BadF/BadG/BcrA/BcrD ATPase family protein [Mycobacteriales bacterium]